MTERVYAARAALHMWEEPCISGKEGSGAVFFTGCPLGCVFCQNREIALGRRSVSPWCRASASETSEDIESCDEILGVPVTEEQLAETFLDLENQRANNINLVTPTHFVPQIIRAVRIARERGLTVPILYNTGSYETEETVRSLGGTVDIFLPDYTKDSKRIIRHLHETYGEKIYVSIMNQYTPMPGIGDEFPELARRVTKREYERVVDYAIELGMENVFIQEGPTSAESFIQDFDGTGLIV